MSRAAIVAASAVSAFGLAWRGFGAAVAEGTLEPKPSSTLLPPRPDLPISEVSPIDKRDDAGDARQRKLMTRPARLAAIAARLALAEVPREERSAIGFFLGVGASGVAMEELPPMLRASMTEEAFSLERFGGAGLAATNPLFAFQTMNNFTLCHAAILEGTMGPNAAYYSRGGGTVLALAEALVALDQGEAQTAIAGGADSALHPVTFSELERGGYVDQGLLPGEGAALMMIAREAKSPLAHVLGCARATSTAALAAKLPPLAAVDAVVIAPWGPPARTALLEGALALAPNATILDVSAAIGDALAASPALGWVAALDRVASGHARSALVLSLGIDGEMGGVVIG